MRLSQELSANAQIFVYSLKPCAVKSLVLLLVVLIVVKFVVLPLDDLARSFGTVVVVVVVLVPVPVLSLSSKKGLDIYGILLNF